MLTLSSVAFVACDKNLDPFDIRQFYGEYNWVEDNGQGSHSIFSINILSEERTSQSVTRPSIFYFNGSNYAVSLSTDGAYWGDTFREINFDINVVNSFNSIMEDLGRNFALTDELFMFKDTGKKYCYENEGWNPNVYRHIILELEGHNYDKLEVELNYDAVDDDLQSYNEKGYTKQLSILISEDVIGQDGEKYFIRIKMLYIRKYN
jgi:hypothetical protein